MVVILDNGHGVDTPGKRSPIYTGGVQLHEFGFNREIVRHIDYELKSRGVKTEILVPELSDVGLTERIRRANSIKGGSILISVHSNAGGGSGFEFFTSPGQTKSDKLAEYFYQASQLLLSGFTLRKDLSDGDSDKEAKFRIIAETNMPAVLTENLFMDNEKDFRFLITETGRLQIVSMHVTAILNYLKDVS